MASSEPVAKKPQNFSAHIPKITVSKTQINENKPSISNMFYNFIIVIMYIITHIFFREVEVTGIHNIPKKGPVILVCAPHSNQFIDGCVVYVPIKQKLGRNISGIIAESSYKQAVIGWFAKLAGSIPVPRAQDNLKPFKDGKIYIKEQDIDNDTVTKIYGKDIKFTHDFEQGGIIGLKNGMGSFKIKEIISDTELILAKPIDKSRAIESLLNEDGLDFKYCPKVDTNKTFQNVFNHLYNQGMIAIFPEGGSHDRTQLLPLKPGVAIMALGSIAAITQDDMDPDAEISIVPTGLYYFHPNKFRSRAVLEFGKPVVVRKKDGENYVKDPKGSVDSLLNTIKLSLHSVIIQAPDRETLRTIQAIRRLYKSKLEDNYEMPLATVNEVNRRLLIGYKHFLNREDIQKLFKSVEDYNRLIYLMGLNDRQIQVQSINTNKVRALKLLVARLAKLIFFLALSFPGITLFLPVFLMVRYYSAKKQREALAKSTVKVKAKDVVASWKVITALVTAPIFYTFYSIVGVKIIRSYDLCYIRNPLLLFVFCYMLLVLTTYCAYRVGEAGMDIFKSFPPLFIQLISSKSIIKLKQYREKLSQEVTDVIDKLGPEIFKDFDEFYEHGSGSIGEESDGSIKHALAHSICVSFSDSLNNVDFFSHGDDKDCESDLLSSKFSDSYEKINKSDISCFDQK